MKLNTLTFFWIFPLFCLCGGECLSAHEDDKDILALPQPDDLPQPAMPDRVQPRILQPGMMALPSHTYAVQGGGIDVSHYQGLINWRMASTDDQVKFVYVKATESNTLVDDFLWKNIVGARKMGIPVGVYHFFSPETSVFTQMKNFTDNVDMRKLDLIPIVDVEKCGKQSLSTFQNHLRMFLQQMEYVVGVKPIIYTGVNFYNQYLAGCFKDYPFMIARYNEEEPPTLSDNPTILLWQYTCEGKVCGINGHVDCSRFLDNFGLSDILLPRRSK